MNKEVTEKQFKKVRTMLSDAESAIKRVPISAIEVNDKCLFKGRILVNGKEVKVSNSFFYKLGSMLNVNISLTRGMINNGDHKIAASLINGLKQYRSKNSGNSEVILVANVKNREVVDICEPKRYRRVTNSTVLDVTERILNDNSNLIVETVDFNPYTGAASINFLNDEEIGFAQAGKDEFFKFGFSIIQTNRDTMVETYNQRLICANGLRHSLGEGAIGGNTNIAFDDKFRLGGTSTEDISIFLNKIDLMKKAGFKNPQFENLINRAVSTKASLYEIEQAFKTATRKIEEPDLDLKKGYQSSIARNYFHSYGDTLARINRKGKDHTKMTDRQKQFVKTGMSVWDVVNSLTYLGSNNSGMPLDNKHELKYSAGDLFGRGVKDGYDLEFAQYASL